MLMVREAIESLSLENPYIPILVLSQVAANGSFCFPTVLLSL